MNLKSKLKIICNQVLSYDEKRVLTLLYLPLIGIGSYSLYQTFYYLVNQDLAVSNFYTHQMLFDILNVDLLKFIKYRDKLEAVGLLDVYVDDVEQEKEYIYILKTPCSAKSFLTEIILGSYLESQVGPSVISELTNLFKIKNFDLSNHHKITKSFNEVYEMKNIELLQIDTPLKGRNHAQGLEIKTDFSYNDFVESLPARYKKAYLVKNSFKKNIEKIQYVYNFTNDELTELLKKSSRNGNEPNMETLKLYAKQLKTYPGTKIITEIKEIALDSRDALESLNPEQILREFCIKGENTIDLDTILTFYDNNNLPIGLLNAVIIYTLKYLEGVLPKHTYLQQVLTTWLNNGVKDTDTAIEYIKTLNTYTKSSKKGKNKKSKSNMDIQWLEDYM